MGRQCYSFLSLNELKPKKKKECEEALAGCPFWHSHICWFVDNSSHDIFVLKAMTERTIGKFFFWKLFKLVPAGLWNGNYSYEEVTFIYFFILSEFRQLDAVYTHACMCVCI